MELYPFRYRDELTGKWTKARYVAELHEIAARYKEWEIAGAPEIRKRMADTGYFRPFAPARAVPSNVERSPILDDAERFLLLVFLRRYVTYCARRGRFAQMQGAAQLARQTDLAGALAGAIVQAALSRRVRR